MIWAAQALKFTIVRPYEEYGKKNNDNFYQELGDPSSEESMGEAYWVMTVWLIEFYAPWCGAAARTTSQCTSN